MFRIFRRSRGSSLVEHLHGVLMERSRQPAFYARFGVADTLEGRFEVVVLHAALLVRRLSGAPEPGPEVARDLTDALFSHFDIALRESGVGDLTVPKKIKKFAQSYLGRSKAYGDALDRNNRGELELAIARNIYGEQQPADAPHCMLLAAYARALEQVLAAAGLDDVYNGNIAWPDVAEVSLRSTDGAIG